MALHRVPITGLVILLGLLCNSAVLAESPTRLAELRISVATGSQTAMKEVKISGQHSLMMPNPGRKLLQGAQGREHSAAALCHLAPQVPVL
jgi:hypothetical protein